MTDWAHLPNARYIDQVLADIPKWGAVSNTARGAVQDAARANRQFSPRTASLSKVSNAARSATWDETLKMARDSMYAKDWSESWGVVWIATFDAVLVLVAYDNCAPLLSYSAQELRALIALTESPAAALLLPRAILKEDAK